MNYLLNKTSLFFLLYLSLLVGFFFNENSSGGALPDFLVRFDLIENFRDDFINTFFEYNRFGDRHSPVLVMILALFGKSGLEIDTIRLVHLHLLPILVIISYKSLTIKFPEIDKKIIFILCSVFFLSPSLRSISIWPDSRLLGLIFFVLSIYFFIKFEKNNEYKYCILNNIFLILSSYISPNFSIFFLYFFYHYFKIFKFSSKLYLMLLINTFLSLPMLFYLFILKINFILIPAITTDGFLNRINPSNKILILSSLIFFYMFPFLFNKYFFKNFLKNLKINYLILSLLFFLIPFFFFNYSIEYTGGGIFFKTSYFLFENNYFFLLVSFFSIIFILHNFQHNLNNIILFFILIFSNPQLSIYHKYYDPLLILLFFLLVNFKFDIRNFIKTNLVLSFYAFYSILLSINFITRYFIF
tara:strand:- start:888 stop:2129 length:1242 start_codon:yes stop_codon:yes gene_type:complete